MSHADDTLQRWHEVAWIESVCDRWDAFFYSLIDQPDRARALCSLGIMAVSGQATMPPQSAGSHWLCFFGSLAGKITETKKLCALGIEMIANGPPRESEAIREKVRIILKSKDCISASGLRSA